MMVEKKRVIMTPKEVREQPLKVRTERALKSPRMQAKLRKLRRRREQKF